MFTSNGITPADVARMSHRNDPDTSIAAAWKAAEGTKKARLYRAIQEALTLYGPSTPSEVFVKLAFTGSFPSLDVYDVRRRMTELEHDFDRIEPVMVGDKQERRDGQRVMRLVGRQVA